jgi:chemotaxis protein methyltransferase CheR
VSRLGFQVHPHNEVQVEQVLRRCLERTGCADVDAYVRCFADTGFARRELEEIALELSVPETYFFRHAEHFRALVEIALPERIRVRRDTRALSLLSAGCATGEEPYSLAAALMDVPEILGWDLAILGVDVSPRLVEAARLARYSPWALRACSEAQRHRYFDRKGDAYRLDASLTSRVLFEQRNLLDDDPHFWRRDRFDIIFCRNVLIYLSTAAIRSLVERFSGSLAPGGFLFLGPSETLRGISHEFHLRHTHGAFYYQRRLAHEAVATHAWAPPSRQEPPTALQSVPEAPRAGAWASAIVGAGNRIAELADRSRSGSADPALAPAPQSSGTARTNAAFLDHVRELLREERFDEALEAIGPLPRDEGADPDALLLQAVALANKGDLTAAGDICRELLEWDELRPGVHYLLAVCAERRGDALAAAEHDQTAIYLDPAFAMPHLHLGLLARRMGDLATARRELAEALALLAHEETARLLLFGGGFSRGALIRSCKAQLDRCGGGE